MKKRVTLSFDVQIYGKYKKYCEEKGYVISKQVELFMKRSVKKQGDEQ